MNELQVTPSPLDVAVQQSGLEIESAQSLHLAFDPLFKQAEEWRVKVAAIKITDVSQVREMKMAREIRLALREIRIKAENIRKQMKEDSLRKGKAIDGVANVLKFLIEPLEESLLAQEKFAERQEAERKEKLSVMRSEKLRVFQVDTSFYNLGEMTDESFEQLLSNTIAAHQAREEAARKAEAERIAREKAEAEERERVRLENEKLRKEAAEREESMRQERLRLQAIAEVERQKAAAKLAEERKKSEAEAKAQADKTRKEREAREAAESELRAAKAKSEAEAKAQAEAQRLAEIAPDKEKIRSVTIRLMEFALPSPDNLKSKEAVKLISDVRLKLNALAGWLEDVAKTL